MPKPWEKYQQGGPINSGVNPTTVIAQQNSNRQQDQFDYQRQRDQQADAEKAQQRAEETARLRGAREDAAAQLRNVIGKIDNISKDVNDSWTGVGGLGETGWWGWAQSGVPGSAAYSLRNDLKTIDSVQVLQAMTRLKELSPTGSTGFGALSAPELELLRSSVANLNPDSDHATFVKNLKEARRVYEGMLRRLEQQPPAAKPAAKPQSGAGLSDLMRKYGGR